MKLHDGTEITRETAAHKFGGDPMAEYLWALSMEQGNGDEEDGDVEAPTGWFARFGRRILFTDEQGFVWQHRYTTEAEAAGTFQILADEYCAWAFDPTDQSEYIGPLPRD